MERHLFRICRALARQLAKYEELDLEITPPKHQLRMLQNAVGDVEALAQIKLMNYHDVKRGHPP
jgi:hypothetical protein